MMKHRTVRVRTPYYRGEGEEYGSYGLVDIDEQIVGMILAIWKLNSHDGFVRTYACCQGDDNRDNGYLMVQHGYESRVRRVIERFGYRILTYTPVVNYYWPSKTWDDVRFKKVR